MSGHESTVDVAEIGKFEAMAAEWWDPDGKFRPLHEMNPCRLDYITGQIAGEFGRDLSAARPFDGLRLLDIGCGGGLLSEPMARLGATVTGADAAEGNITMARLHAEKAGLEIDYRCTTAEDLAARNERFDIVLAMEIIEHVADPAAFVAACHDLISPGGLIIGSTLNRTAKSYALAIVGAEYLLRWLPTGTHDWNRFVTPDEFAGHLDAAGIRTVDRKGFVYNPLTRNWRHSETDLAVNYAITGRRPAA